MEAVYLPPMAATRARMSAADSPCEDTGDEEAAGLEGAGEAGAEYELPAMAAARARMSDADSPWLDCAGAAAGV